MGYVNMNNDMFVEQGYISIDKILENSAELDRDWKPVNTRII